MDILNTLYPAVNGSTNADPVRTALDGVIRGDPPRADLGSGEIDLIAFLLLTHDAEAWAEERMPGAMEGRHDGFPARIAAKASRDLDRTVMPEGVRVLPAGTIEVAGNHSRLTAGDLYQDDSGVFTSRMLPQDAPGNQPRGQEAGPESDAPASAPEPGDGLRRVSGGEDVLADAPHAENAQLPPREVAEVDQLIVPGVPLVLPPCDPVLEEALRLLGVGVSVILLAHGDFLHRWKAYQDRRALPDEFLAMWWKAVNGGGYPLVRGEPILTVNGKQMRIRPAKAAEMQLGVVAGEISGNAFVVDFDTEES
ncbi:MAG: hypothetical protein LBQ79_02710, partial [Deltaproteobacteria bacterium]|nr:hypothetical protein [Deltaproteobacteria bacterium]